jgi:outer membrane beta-barrel protein
MRRFPFLPTTLSALAAFWLVGPNAYAQDEVDEEQVASYAVQSRLFRLGGELTVAAGFLPVNAFNKGLTVGGSFTYHISNSWAWEVIHGAYVYKQLDTGLKKELLDNFNAKPTEISALDYVISTNVLLKPFYGKLAVFNRRVIHLEVSVPFGAAFSRYINPQAYLPGVDAGLIFRIFVSPHVSFCLDVRDYVFFHPWDTKNWNTRQEVHVSLGAAFAWGGDER